MPIDWNLVQKRYVDPYESYHSDKVDRLTSIIAPNGRLIVSGFEVTCLSTTQLQITKGIIIKDYVVIELTEDVILDLTDTNGQEGNNLIVLDYEYAKIYPPQISKIDVLLTSAYYQDKHLVLGYIEIDANGFVESTLSQQDPTGTYVREYNSTADFLRNSLRQADSGDYIFDDDVVIQGDLTVQGNLTSIETTNTEISDNVILLNNGETGDGITDTGNTSGLQIDRGNLVDATWVFDDTIDVWKGEYLDGNDIHIRVPLLPTQDYHATSKKFVDDHDWLHSDIIDWDESVQDTVGGMVYGNTELGISVTYNATTRKLDFNVNDPTITFSGDLTGSFTISDLSDVTANVSVNDNSHNHISTNISDWDEAVQNTVGGMVSSNVESGISVVYDDINRKLNFDVNDPVITFGGDVSGSGTLINLADLTIDLTVNDSDKLDGLDADSFLRRDVTSLPTQDESYDLGSSSYKWNNIYAVTFNGTATQAEYADLAEKYTVKENVEVGDVILISEDENVDCELSNEYNSYRVLGIVSENPAFMMNSDLEDGVYIALKGRVKCKVQGPVKKGEPLVSYINGTAIGKFNKNSISYNVLGKSLESIQNEEVQIIEIVVL